MNGSDPYIADRCTEIESVLNEAETWSAVDPKLGAYLAGYITVLISGVVEDCIEYVIKERAKRANDPELLGFVSKLLEQRFRNPRSEEIAGLLSMFSSQYQEEYRTSIPRNAPDALGSIIANRMSLAHTGTWKQQTTVSDVRNYFLRITPILAVVEHILLKK